MADPIPTVRRIINYGGYRRESVVGGSAVEYYEVVGLGPDEWDRAHAEGLPKKATVHPNPVYQPGSFYNVGLVQDIDQIQEFGKLGWIARVRWSLGGTFNFGVLLGQATGNDVEPLELPILQHIGNGPPGSVYRVPNPRVSIPRYCITMRITTRATQTLAVIAQITAKNIGKIYTFDNIDYQLAGAPATQDQGNNIRVDTRFRCRGPVAVIPIGTYGNDVAIPDLPVNSDWHSNTNTGVIDIVHAIDTQGRGDPLPWIPP